MSLCLQFKPHHIAAGAIFLAAKFLKVKLPSDGEKVWWQEFDVTPRQLEEVSNQMLELYEQNRVPSSQASEAEGSAAGNQRPCGKASAVVDEEHVAANSSNSQAGGAGTPRPASSRSLPDPQSYAENHGGSPRSSHSRGNDYGSAENNFSDHRIGESEIDDMQNDEREPSAYQGSSAGEVQSRSRFGAEGSIVEDDDLETRDRGELKDKYHSQTLAHKDGALGQEVVKKIDKDKVKAAVENKVKAALEKPRKSQGDVTRKTDVMDEDDLIERELEDGIELVAGSDKSKRERKQSWSKHENAYHIKRQDEVGDGHYQSQSSYREDLDNMEEGELEPYDDDDADRGYDHHRQATGRGRQVAPWTNRWRESST